MSAPQPGQSSNGHPRKGGYPKDRNWRDWFAAGAVSPSRDGVYLPPEAAFDHVPRVRGPKPRGNEHVTGHPLHVYITRNGYIELDKKLRAGELKILYKGGRPVVVAG